MALELWVITAAANAVMVLVYAGIAFFIIRGIAAGGQWRSNPIALATAAVFVSCTVGHGLHLAHVIPPLSLVEPVESAAARTMFGDWRLLAWDVVTAGVAAWYWAIRSRLAIVYQGASLCEDMMERQRQAALLQERVVLGLARAEAELAAGNREAGLQAVDETLEESKGIITTLLGARGSHASLGPGDLKRKSASH